MSVIQARLETKQTGASWQRQCVQHYIMHEKCANHEAQQKMLEDYTRHSLSNTSVSEWPLPQKLAATK